MAIRLQFLVVMRFVRNIFQEERIVQEVMEIIQIRKTTLAHQQLKSTVKNAIKETDKAVLAGNKELADKSLKKAIKALDNAKVKGLVHKNKVDREKSRLTKKVNTMEVK